MATTAAKTALQAAVNHDVPDTTLASLFLVGAVAFGTEAATGFAVVATGFAVVGKRVGLLVCDIGRIVVGGVVWTKGVGRFVLFENGTYVGCFVGGPGTAVGALAVGGCAEAVARKSVAVMNRKCMVAELGLNCGK